MNKNATITLGDLRKILSDGRLTDDMPVTIYSDFQGLNRGGQAVEIHTLTDGSKAVSLFQRGTVYAVTDIDSAGEVFGSI